MKLLKFVCIILLFCCSSCEVLKYTTVNVEYTPRLTLKPGLTTVLLINQFDLSIIKRGTQRKKDAIKAGAIGSLRYAQNQLRQLPNTKVINIADSVDLKVNTDSVKALTEKYHVDYVLALNNFYADIDMAEMNSATVSYNRSAEVHFSLFDGSGVFNKKLDGTITEAHSDQPNMGLIATLIFMPSVGGNKQSIITAAEHATQIALQDYLPYTITHQRPVFNDPIFEPAVAQIFAHNYDKADTLLQPILKSTNPEISGKAAYNLAVVYEAQGDINAAVGMAQTGWAKFKNPHLEALLSDLQKE
jgi:hypothetical protein